MLYSASLTFPLWEPPRTTGLQLLWNSIYMGLDILRVVSTQLSGSTGGAKHFIPTYLGAYNPRWWVFREVEQTKWNQGSQLVKRKSPVINEQWLLNKQHAMEDRQRDTLITALKDSLCFELHFDQNWIYHGHSSFFFLVHVTIMHFQ